MISISKKLIEVMRFVCFIIISLFIMEEYKYANSYHIQYYILKTKNLLHKTSAE